MSEECDVFRTNPDSGAQDAAEGTFSTVVTGDMIGRRSHQEEDVVSDIEGNASDPRLPWGVLGIGTPLAFPEQDPPDVIVPAVGVQGVASDSPESIANFRQQFGDEATVQSGAGAGVLGVRLAVPRSE